MSECTFNSDCDFFDDCCSGTCRSECGLSAGAIVGIAFGCFFAFVLFMCFCFFYFAKNANSNMKVVNNQTRPVTAPYANTTAITTVTYSQPQDYKMHETDYAQTTIYPQTNVEMSSYPATAGNAYSARVTTPYFPTTY